MIYFYDELVDRTLKMIKESYDCADVLNDLNRIEQAVTSVNLYGNRSAAEQLDRELRQKYPCIEIMLALADSMLVRLSQASGSLPVEEMMISNLRQDYFGILCDTALKKQLIHSTKEFIKNVE